MKYSVLLLLYALGMQAGNNPVLTSAQTDLKKANDSYAKTPNFSMDTYYTVYSEHKDKNYLDAKTGSYIRYGKNMYVKIDDIETYTIGDKLICLSHEDKAITIGDNKELDFHPLQQNIDSILTLCSSIRSEILPSGEKAYQLYFEDSGMEFERMDIYLDPKTYHYTKVVLFYSAQMNLTNDFYADEKQPRLEISYKNFKPLLSAPEIFDAALYISSDGKKLIPAGKYHNYKISDLRNKKSLKNIK